MDRRSGGTTRPSTPSAGAQRATPACRLVVSQLRRRGPVLTSICLLLLVFVPLPVSGQEWSDASVRLDGRILFRVGAFDERAPARAERIEQRLDALLETPDAITPARVDASQDGSERIVVVGGVPLVTITQDDADDNAVPIDVLAERWADILDEALAEAERSRLSLFGRFGAEVVGAIRASLSRLSESIVTVVPRALAAGLLLVLFAVVAVVIRRVLGAIFVPFIRDRTLENLIRQLTYYAIWIVGIFLAADALGFEPEVVVTGLGLTGLVLGFALRDVLSNFVSGLLLLLLRPFARGPDHGGRD